MVNGVMAIATRPTVSKLAVTMISGRRTRNPKRVATPLDASAAANRIRRQSLFVDIDGANELFEWRSEEIEHDLGGLGVSGIDGDQQLDEKVGVSLL